jgi:hypothetical protein
MPHAHPQPAHPVASPTHQQQQQQLLLFGPAPATDQVVSPRYHLQQQHAPQDIKPYVGSPLSQPPQQQQQQRPPQQQQQQQQVPRPVISTFAPRTLQLPAGSVRLQPEEQQQQQL